MNRLHITVLAIVLLLSQLGSVNHVYHDHDVSEVCDFCLSAHVLDQGFSPTTQFAITPCSHQFQIELVSLTDSSNDARYYSVRAPPRFI